jgi:hypothetical protein
MYFPKYSISLLEEGLREVAGGPTSLLHPPRSFPKFRDRLLKGGSSRNSQFKDIFVHNS